MGDIEAETGDIIFEAHLLGKQTVARAAEAVAAIEQRSGINFCVSNCVWGQEINRQSHKVVNAKTVPGLLAPMIEDAKTQSLVDGMHKNMPGIVLMRSLWVLLHDKDELIKVPSEWHCDECVPDTSRPSLLGVLTEWPQEKIAHQLWIALNGCHHWGKTP